jgi:ribosome-binding protein aMBF1 (putative translation factor)
MEHQDWKPVSWDKRGVKQNNETNTAFMKRMQNTGNKTTVIKQAPVNHSTSKNLVTSAKKLEEENEYFKHKSVSLSIAKNIAKKRLEMKLSQKDLAFKLALPENIIKSYEKGDGKTVYNPSILNKIENVIGRVRDNK